jgi:type 1 glutamine amidotransferase
LNEAGKVVRDTTPGAGGHHGPQHEFIIRIRDTEHPITKGLPREWLHTKDELYDMLRGPAEDVHILATAFASPEYDGTGRHEPMLMTLKYGNGRVFHTVLGHADYSMNSVGFINTLQRGAEWAAKGEVTIPVAEDFPTANESRSRE